MKFFLIILEIIYNLSLYALKINKIFFIDIAALDDFIFRVKIKDINI